MAQNKVSMVISAQQKTNALAAIASLEAALVGMVSLEPDERRRLARMGPKSEAFARGTIRVLAGHATVVPSGLNVAAAQADLAALDQLLPIADALNRCHLRVQDTLAALGSDAMDVALDGYKLLKAIGDAHGLEDLRKDLGARFAKAPRAKVP